MNSLSRRNFLFLVSGASLAATLGVSVLAQADEPQGKPAMAPGSATEQPKALPPHPAWTKSLEDLQQRAGGRLGVAVLSGEASAEVNGDQRFSLQSVVKLIVSAAALEAIDGGEFGLHDKVMVKTQDLSLFVQPLADKVRAKGGAYETTYDEMIRLAVNDSDSAANDIMFEKLGGEPALRKFLDSRGLTEMRVDRSERDLQTEIVGIRWQPEFVDGAVLDAAIKATPESVRTAAYDAYLKDPRDTTTPREMANFLRMLQDGELLSAKSTAYLLEVMKGTNTGPDRLKAGLAPGWTIGHKTGTSGGWNGVTAATNDVGILYGPRGEILEVAALVGDSRLQDAERAAIIAEVSRILTSPR